MSVFLTVIVQNIHFKPSAAPMPKFVRRIFIHFLGNYLLIYRRPGSPYRSKRKACLYKKLPTLNALNALDDHFKRVNAQSIDVDSLNAEEIVGAETLADSHSIHRFDHVSR